MKLSAKKLRSERERRAWSQEQVAEQLGTTAPNVSRWERGITFPSLHFRRKLSELFGKSLEELGLLIVTDLAEEELRFRKSDTDT